MSCRWLKASGGMFNDPVFIWRLVSIYSLFCPTLRASWSVPLCTRTPRRCRLEILFWELPSPAHVAPAERPTWKSAVVLLVTPETVARYGTLNIKPYKKFIHKIAFNYLDLCSDVLPRHRWSSRGSFRFLPPLSVLVECRVLRIGLQ